jgi:hypothetical protein
MKAAKWRIALIALAVCLVAGCKNIQGERGGTTGEKRRAAYQFLFEKLKEENINLIATEGDEDLGLIEELVEEDGLGLAVERYANIERGADLCYYSKNSREMVAIVGVEGKGRNRYYVSYYLGPEGGASKEIEMEERSGRLVVVNDDGWWQVK